MPWNLQRVLLWLSVISGVFLALSVINDLWPLNPNQPAQRLLVGDMVFAGKFFFSIAAYSLIRNGKVKAGLGVVVVWICCALAYAFGVLIFEPLSGFTASVFLGELFICGLLAYYSLLEAKSYASFQRASKSPSA